MKEGYVLKIDRKKYYPAKQRKLPYVISQVPSDMRVPGSPEDLWYCFNRVTPKTPVFGSIGDKKKASEVCRIMNESLGFGRKVGRP